MKVLKNKIFVFGDSCLDPFNPIQFNLLNKFHSIALTPLILKAVCISAYPGAGSIYGTGTVIECLL